MGDGHNKQKMKLTNKDVGKGTDRMKKEKKNRRKTKSPKTLSS
jgi:hypothetical protein